MMFNISKEWRGLPENSPEQATKPLYIEGQNHQNSSGSHVEVCSGRSRLVHDGGPMDIQAMESSTGKGRKDVNAQGWQR